MVPRYSSAVQCISRGNLFNAFRDFSPWRVCAQCETLYTEAEHVTLCGKGFTGVTELCNVRWENVSGSAKWTQCDYLYP